MQIIRLGMLIVCVHISAVLVMGSLEATGLAKPIADLRDYNGTYSGAVGTGRYGYDGGTLYRDNQDNGSVAGCRGEGCGRHPGVDIPIRSGTNVYAAQSGVIVVNRCDPSWGGLVVIRANNPWNYSETIYYTYAHLRLRRYSEGKPLQVGDMVTTGQRLGESGGGSSDVCPGRSTGPHLHFQIDKDDGNSEPYYPALSQLNMKDDGFVVTSKTYNPIPFVTGGYRWSFAENNNRELWELFNFESWGVSGNALWVDAGFDPYIRRSGLVSCGLQKRCSANIAAEAVEYPQVFLDLYNGCTTGVGKVYFTTSNDSAWSESKSVPYYTNLGSYRTHVWMANNPKWTGVITGLRIDPSEQCNPYAWDPVYYGEITIER